MPTPDIIEIGSPDATQVEVVGTKAWHLARLRSHGFPTPDAFIVTTAAYGRAVQAGRIARQLDDIWESARRARADQVKVLARTAGHLFSELRADGDLVEDVTRHVEALGPNVDVAVRSSVPPSAVSGPDGAGVFATFTDVTGSESVVSRIHACWTTLFGERALAMRRRGLGSVSPSMAVVVQPMVHAEAAGIAVPFRRPSDVLVEATFGLGEPIVSGAVEPDRYLFDITAGTTRSVTIGRKQIVVPAHAGGRHEFAPVDQQHRRVLDDAAVATVAHLCSDVAAAFDEPHEIEWALDDSGLVVLQARPIDPIHDIRDPALEGLVSGLGVGLGTATGRVRTVHADSDLDGIRPGDVVVASSTVPSWQPHLGRATAIVTDTGDEHSHAARIARELGIPAVVATGDATTRLDDGTMATVDAQRGWVLSTPNG